MKYSWVKKCVHGPRTSKKQRLYSNPGVSDSRDSTHRIKPNCLHLEAAEGAHLLRSCQTVSRFQPSCQPWPRSLLGELGRCLCAFQTKRGMKLSNLGSQREDEFNKHRFSLTQNGVAGWGLWCLLAVETRTCPAEEFYDIPRTLSVAFPTSEKNRCQETGSEWVKYKTGIEHIPAVVMPSDDVSLRKTIIVFMVQVLALFHFLLQVRFCFFIASPEWDTFFKVL